jgi:hypothetical protein
LNQLKDDEPHHQKVKTSLGMANVETDFMASSSSPNPTFDNFQSGKTMKDKKNSFLKVEEFRKSKQFRESKIPTNTSFSGVEKNQYQTSKNKSFDLINYQSKRKSKFTKRNNKTHNFYYNVNELLKSAAISNKCTVYKKDSMSKERKHKRMSTNPELLILKLAYHTLEPIISHI